MSPTKAPLTPEQLAAEAQKRDEARKAAGWTERDFKIVAAKESGARIALSGELGNLRIGGYILEIITPMGQRPTYNINTVVGQIAIEAKNVYAVGPL